jgi:hypothetical protein
VPIADIFHPRFGHCTAAPKGRLLMRRTMEPQDD